MKRLTLESVADRIFSFRPNEAFTKDEVLAQMHAWNADVRSVKRGEILLKAGMPATKFLMLLDGVLQRRLPSQRGKDIVVGAVRPGDFTGVPSLFMDEKTFHPLDVVAVKDAIVVFYEVARLRAARNDPKLMPLFFFLASIMSRLLEDARQHAIILTGKSISERLRRYLMMRRVKDRSRTIVVPGTESDFAQHLGVNKCALSRTLNQLRAKGKIDYRRNVITILD